MSEDSKVERVLRAALAERATGLEPPADLERQVYRRHRIRVRLLVAAAAAGVVLVGVGVPAGLTALRADAPPAGPEPTPSRAACKPQARPAPTATPVPAGELPRQTGVRGSLAADRALVDAVLVAGWQGLQAWAKKPDMQGERRTMDVRTLQLRFVERAGAGVVALVTADDTTGRWQAAQWVLREGDRLLPAVVQSDMVESEDFERRTGQLFSGDDPLFISSTGVCGREYGVVLAPPDATAELRRRPSVGADGRLVHPPARALQLRDGLAVFPVDSPRPAIEVSRAGVVLGSSTLIGAGLRPGFPGPPREEAERAAREAPGDADPRLAEAGASAASVGLDLAVTDRPTGMRVLWGGRLRNGNAVLLGALRLPSGADCVFGARAYRADQFGTPLAGLLPAGRLDDTVFSWQDNDYVVVVATKATRAEVVLPGGTVLPVPLTQGGGSVVVPSGTRAQLVRAYAADGSLIGERAPGTGLLPMPSW
jgi:hypothetical protein